MSKGFSISGQIKEVCSLQTGKNEQTGKSWQRQDFIIVTKDDYPKNICFTMFGENIQKIEIEKYVDEEEVEVFCNVESKESNGRWYTSLLAWRVAGKEWEKGKVENAKKEVDAANGVDLTPEPCDEMPF
jgi:hypothetical protein